MASKRKLRRKSCEKKTKYPSHQAAEKSRRSMCKRLSRMKDTHVYHCNFCKGYHIGHEKKNNGKRNSFDQFYNYDV